MTQPPTGFARHDHSECRATALQTAEALCAQKGVKWTAQRRKTLEILLESHVAMGAYDVLARLDQAGLGSKPPVAYRALGFLVEHGLAHKIERLNAFVACAHPSDTHQAAFMICRSCKQVAEFTPVGSLEAAARAAGFVIEHTVIEAEGLCPDCNPAGAC